MSNTQKNIPTLVEWLHENHISWAQITPDTMAKYAKEIIKYTLEKVNTEQKLRFNAGETGYLNKESILYLEDEIIKQLGL